GLGSDAVNSLTQFSLLYEETSGVSISNKAFYDRLPNYAFSEFMKQCCERLLANLTPKILRVRRKWLRQFKDIAVHDGTSYGVCDELARVYPGKFRDQTPAAIALHCTYSILRSQPISLALTPYCMSEHHSLPDAKNFEGQLVLLDAGFLWYAKFKEFMENGADFIVRGRTKPRGTILKVYHGLPNSWEGRKLQDIKRPARSFDVLAEVRDEAQRKYQFRMVFAYNSEKRRHTVLYTSLSRSRFRGKNVAQLYRLRWQVELYFKECKSYTGLKKFQTGKPHIVEGLVWAAAMASIVRRYLLHAAVASVRKFPSQFLGAAHGWLLFGDLARCLVGNQRGLPKVVEGILEFLRRVALRTNPKRKSDLTDLLEVKATYA
ncbi:MAG: IS4 family transposase, partial [Planctomycetes bacterium]|nr:IS4 family transposase [Planctomycetota bacterium]